MAAFSEPGFDYSCMMNTQIIYYQYNWMTGISLPNSSLMSSRIALPLHKANLNVKDALFRLRKNTDKPLWEVPSNCPREYLDILDSESRSYDKGRWSWKQIGDRPNHYLDCEAMQVAVATMLKLVGQESMKEAE